MDPQGSLSLEPVTTPGHGNLGASLLSSYAYRLVRVDDEQGKAVAIPLRHQLSYDFLFNLGLGNRWALGLAFPVVAYQHGSRVPSDTWVVPKTALGDPTIEAKILLVPKGDLGGLGLAGHSRVTLPLGSEESAVGAGAVTTEFGLRGEMDLILLGLRARVGYVFRGEDRVFWGDQFGDYAPWGLGIVLKPRALGWDKENRWQWFLEGHGAVAITPEFGTKHSSPAALGIGARYYLGADCSALSGVELPLSGALGAPSLRAVLGVTWAPRFLDADGDGIADDADDCPEFAEDRDNFEDDDGCPEDDNDGDGTPDAQDQCPNLPEDLDGFRDNDGCPDPDNDGDHILDVDDNCPMQPGVPSKTKRYNGCVPKDSDVDSIMDEVDRCPEHAEDLDGFHDEDGCPDPDNDADGILDQKDDCPNERGPRRDIGGLNGCPNPDTDEDTYFGVVGDAFASVQLFGAETRPTGTPRDLCPQEAEDFDDDADDDGCFDPPNPKKKSPPLISFEITGNDGSVRFARAPKWSNRDAESLSAKDMALLRALAKELLNHKEWVAQVGVRPSNQQPESLELARRRADLIVRQLKRFTLRDNCANVVDFVSVAEVPFAKQSGIGITLRFSSRRARPPLEKAKAPQNSSTQSR